MSDARGNRTATVIKHLNEVNERCLVEIELALQDLDPEPAGAWDTVRGLRPQDTSTLALDGLSAPAEEADEAGVVGEVDAFASGPPGLQLYPIRPLPHPPSWRWRIWKARLRVLKPS